MKAILKRRASFSAAHNYFLEGHSAEENHALFGNYASGEGHGHNYRIEIDIAGEIDESTGMVVNISDIDRILKSRVVAVLDGKFLNREIDYFRGIAPTLENIVKFVSAQIVPELPQQVSLCGATVWETDTLWASWRDPIAFGGMETEKQMIHLTRAYDFSASHRLHSQVLSDAENRDIFGKCNSPNGHGHNYEVEVTLVGTPNESTGMLYSLETLDSIVDETVLLPLDHKHLNLDVPEFETINPTSEMLAVVIWRRLATRLPIEGDPRLAKVLVRETARNSFEYCGG